MEVAAKKMKRGRRESSKEKISFERTKDCLMKKAYELTILCGSHVSIILYDPFSKQTELWPPNDSVEVNSVVNHYYASAPTAACRKKKVVNLTLSDLDLPTAKKVREKDLPDCIADLSTQKLVAMDGKIDAMLMGGNMCPSKVDRFEALMEKNPPVYGLCGNGSDHDTELSNIVKLLMSDHDTQFGGDSNVEPNVCQNQGLCATNMVGPLFCANPQFDQCVYGTLGNGSGAESYGNQDMVDWEPSSTQLQPLDSSSSSDGNQIMQLQMLPQHGYCSNALDCYYLQSQSMSMNGDGDMMSLNNQYGVEFGSLNNIFNTLFSDQ